MSALPLPHADPPHHELLRLTRAETMVQGTQLPGAARALGAVTSIVPAVVAMTAPTIAVRPIRLGLLIPMIRNRSVQRWGRMPDSRAERDTGPPSADARRGLHEGGSCIILSGHVDRDQIPSRS